MRNPLKPTNPVILLAIRSHQNKPLFRVYRDYLIFINLIRELAQSHQHRLFGFSWLKYDAWLLCQPGSERLIKQLFSLIQRYYLWLQHIDDGCEEFNIQALTLMNKAQSLDALRFIHSRATASGQVKDALDYHWHSYPIYNEFWQLNWLDTKQMLNYFSSNHIIALNEFRKHMQYPCDEDFEAILSEQSTRQALYPDSNYDQTKTMVTEPHHHYLKNISRLQTIISAQAFGLKVVFNNCES